MKTDVEGIYCKIVPRHVRIYLLSAHFYFLIFSNSALLVINDIKLCLSVPGTAGYNEIIACLSIHAFFKEKNWHF